MFAISVQDGEPVILCYSNWEKTPHRGNLRVSLASSADFEKFLRIIILLMPAWISPPSGKIQG